MIITVNELRQFITTTETNQVLEFKIQALESFICQYTNNSFVNRSTGKKDYPPDIKMGVINLMNGNKNIVIKLVFSLKPFHDIQ